MLHGYRQAEAIYDDISKDVEIRFDNSNYESEKLPKEKNEKFFGLMKYKLCGKLMTEFAALRPKAYSYVTDDSDKTKESKMHKKVCH